jgi:outer membrane receptor protein involved in Fe transport
VEAGLRGKRDSAPGPHIAWHAGLFRTDADDDILFVASPTIGRAFFRNIGDTRRQGVESSLDIQSGKWSLSFDYSYTDATFRNGLILNSPENPRTDINGQIRVLPGDNMPNVPQHLFKAVAAVEPVEGWSIALSARAASGVYLQGDESNLNRKTQSYWLFDIGTQYRVTKNISLFGSLTNIFDTDDETFGTFAPTADVDMTQAPGASNPRSLSPGRPRAIFGGIRLKI